MYYLYSILYLLLVQTRATSAGGSAASTTGSAPADTTGGTGAAPAEPASFFESMFTFLPLMLAFMLVYLLLMKPQAKGAASSGKVLDLKKNDKVVTAGGVVGTVIKNDPESDTTTLRVDDSGNTRMQFLTSSIVKVLTDDKDSEKSSSGKK